MGRIRVACLRSQIAAPERKGRSAEAFGAMDFRPNDHMGIGYFYNGLNADFECLFAGTNPLQDVHGV